MLPSTFSENPPAGRIGALFLGYAHISVRDLFTRVRTHESQREWTHCMDDASLKDCLRNYIELSQFYEKECQQYGISYIDVGLDIADGYRKAYVTASEWLRKK